MRAARERVGEAAAALRRRPAREVLDRLAAWLDAWSAPGSAWQRALVRALPQATGFSEAVVREGLAAGLAPYTGKALHALVETELGGVGVLDEGGPRVAMPYPVTAVLLAGALPTPTFASLLAPLAVRSGVVAKTASHDPVTAHHVRASLCEMDPELGASVEVVSFPGGDAPRTAALLEAECVVATGDDGTVARVREALRPGQRLVAHGHRFSVGAVGAAATRGRALAITAEGLARDVALWDQLGCLSPVVVYVDEADAAAPDRVAEALAEALAEAEARWPRGHVAPDAAAVGAHERAEAEMRAAAGHGVRLLAPPDARWTVVREEDARWRPAPLHRFVRVQPVAGAAGLLEALRPRGAWLAGVARAGWEDAELDRALLALGTSRVCGPGRLQTPPLDWPRGGLPVLGSLVRWGAAEPTDA